MAELNNSLQGNGDSQVDMDAMSDFFDDFKISHKTCDSVLLKLEDDPENNTLLNSLFRSIHTIKGNLIYVGLEDLTPLIQSLEDLLDAIRKKSVTYDSLLCDVILLTLDRTESMIQLRLSSDSDHLPIVLSDADIDNLCANISCIADVAPKARIKYIRTCLLILDPDTQLNPSLNDSMTSTSLTDDIAIVEETQTKAEEDCTKALRELKVNTEYLVSDHPIKHKNINDVFLEHDIEIDDDLIFFIGLVSPLESRSFFWKGRTLRLLILSLAMNEKSGLRVDKTQLAVAVLIHDLGMSFLSRSLLTNTGALSENERLALQRHPGTSSLLLNESEKWSDAAQMVLQHHEQLDGSGYPNHLIDEQICQGAKILAIADTFDARSHERAHHTLLKRPLIRTMIEINNFSGTQFDPYWVDIFNHVVCGED